MPTPLIIYIIGIFLSVIAFTILVKTNIRKLNADFKTPVYKIGYTNLILASVLWPITILICLGLFIKTIIDDTREKRGNK